MNTLVTKFLIKRSGSTLVLLAVALSNISCANSYGNKSPIALPELRSPGSLKEFVPDKKHEFRLPKLKNGSVPVLKCIYTSDSTKVTAAWYPDGTPMDITHFEGRTFMSSSSDRGLSLAVRISFENAPTEITQYRGHGGKGTESHGWGSSHDQLEISLDNVTVPMTDIQLGVPFGKFQVLFDGQPNTGVVRMTRTNPPRATVVVQAPKFLVQKDIDFKAFDQQGAPAAQGSYGFGAVDTKKPTVEFKHDELVSRSPIERICISYRDIEWVTFKGVHLKSN